jgi:hypothetical protein
MNLIVYKTYWMQKRDANETEGLNTIMFSVEYYLNFASFYVRYNHFYTHNFLCIFSLRFKFLQQRITGLSSIEKYLH